MKTHIYSLFIFLFLATSINAQELRDSISNEPIPFVEIYSDQGDLLGRTDYSGKIGNQLFQKILDSKISNIAFVQSFYQSKEIAVETFKNNQTVKLSPLVLSLLEVVVQPNSDYKNLLLTAYFRSLQIDKVENRPHYYMDGFVKFYINQKTGKIKTVFICNHSLENKNITHFKETKTVFIGIKSCGVPDLLNIPQYSTLSKKYSLATEMDSIIIADKKQVEKTMGRIISKNNNTELSLNLYPEEQSFFGIKGIYNDHNVFAVYEGINLTDYSLNDLVYFKESKSVEAKKKEKSQKADVIYEIFVVDKEYTNEDFKGNFGYYWFVPSGSVEICNKEVDNVYFQPLPSSLSEYMKNHLTEYK